MERTVQPLRFRQFRFRLPEIVLVGVFDDVFVVVVVFLFVVEVFTVLVGCEVLVPTELFVLVFISLEGVV